MVDNKASHLEIDIAGDRYDIRQSPGLLTSSNAEGTTGAALWKISPLVAEWLIDKTNALWSTGVLHPDAVVLELGCGITGLIGLVLSKRISRYILTDQRSVLKLLQENVDANAPPDTSMVKRRSSRKAHHTFEAVSKTVVMELNWETDDVDALNEALQPADDIDLVIVCDCVFNDFLLQPLVAMCQKTCLRSPEKKTILLIAQQLRSDEVYSSFMGILLRTFRVWRLSDVSLSPALQDGSGFAVHLAVLR